MKHSHTVARALVLGGGLAAAVGVALAQQAPHYPITPAQRATAVQVAQSGVPISELAKNAPDEYTVRRGDTLWDIAQRLTGHGRNWPALVEHHNRRVEIGMGGRLIRDPSRIRIGDKIHVPLSNTEPDAIEYHVSQGESLSRIAWRIYGDASMWRQIHEDNRRTIPNPDLLHPGQVLLLRARTTR